MAVIAFAIIRLNDGFFVTYAIICSGEKKKKKDFAYQTGMMYFQSATTNAPGSGGNKI